MKKLSFIIDNNGVRIPAVLWGEPCRRLLLAVHGIQSNKEDTVVALAAEKAVAKGFCALSFDLPQHGGRVGETDYPCNPWNGRSDLLAVYRHAETVADEISVFACSLGAYLTMLAYPDRSLHQLLFLSPVVNMAHIIEGMIAAAGVSAEQLEKEKLIPLPGGQTLDWEYYSYVREHPIKYERPPEGAPMAILYGQKDTLCARDDVDGFARRYGAELTVLAEGEHYFHTEVQLSALSQWLDDHI